MMQGEGFPGILHHFFIKNIIHTPKESKEGPSFSYLLINAIATNCQFNDGSKERGTTPPLGPMSFHFMQFVTKCCQIVGFCPKLRGLAHPSGKFWIRHYNSICRCGKIDKYPVRNPEQTKLPLISWG